MNIFNFDKHIVDNYTWETLAKIYKNKVAKEIVIENSSIDVSTILNYIDSFRKLVVEYYVNKSISDDIPKIISNYKSFLEDKSLKDVISYKSFGSESIISDYDISLSGPGSNIILKNIIMGFKEQSKKNTAISFDTNIYISPTIVLTHKNITHLESLFGTFSYFIISKKDDIITAIPIPDTIELFTLEWDFIYKKFTSSHTPLTQEKIDSQYETLLSYANKIDYIVYQMKNLSPFVKTTKKIFYELILTANYNSIESYTGISTTIVVVHGIQNKNEKIFEQLKPYNFLISAFENFGELYHFWQITTTKDDIFISKISKYLYRMLFSLKYASISKYNSYIEKAKYINDHKNDSDIYDNENFLSIKSFFFQITEFLDESASFYDILTIMTEEKNKIISLTGGYISFKNTYHSIKFLN
jgi:hypothetical protein